MLGRYSFWKYEKLFDKLTVKPALNPAFAVVHGPNKQRKCSSCGKYALPQQSLKLLFLFSTFGAYAKVLSLLFDDILRSLVRRRIDKTIRRV